MFSVPPIPKPRFDFKTINKEQLKKISISVSSLPPVPLFPKDRSEKNSDSTDGAYLISKNDGNYTFYDEEKVHNFEHSSEFRHLEGEFLFDVSLKKTYENIAATQKTFRNNISLLKSYNVHRSQTESFFKSHNRTLSL